MLKNAGNKFFPIIVVITAIKNAGVDEFGNFL